MNIKYEFLSKLSHYWWLHNDVDLRLVFTSDGVVVRVVIKSVNLVKTAFRFCLRLRHLRSSYDLVKTRLSELKAEAEVRNQSQSMETCIVIGLFFCFCFRLRQSGFHFIIKDGVLSTIRMLFSLNRKILHF